MPSDGPADQMYPCMNSNSKGHVIIQGVVTSNKSLNDPESAVSIHKMLSLIEITDHLAKIVFFPTVLSKLPVNDEEIHSFCQLLLKRLDVWH